MESNTFFITIDHGTFGHFLQPESTKDILELTLKYLQNLQKLQYLQDLQNLKYLQKLKDLKNLQFLQNLQNLQDTLKTRLKHIESLS